MSAPEKCAECGKTLSKHFGPYCYPADGFERMDFRVFSPASTPSATAGTTTTCGPPATADTRAACTGYCINRDQCAAARWCLDHPPADAGAVRFDGRVFRHHPVRGWEWWNSMHREWDRRWITPTVIDRLEAPRAPAVGETPTCPDCKSALTVEFGLIYGCFECGHSWNRHEPDEDGCIIRPDGECVSAGPCIHTAVASPVPASPSTEHATDER